MTLRFNLHSVDSNKPVTREYSSIRDFISQNGHGEITPDKSFVSADGIQVLKPVTPEAQKLMQGMFEATHSGVNLMSPTRYDVLRGLGLDVNHKPGERGEDPVSITLDHLDYRLDPDGYLETPMGRTFIVHSKGVDPAKFKALQDTWMPSTPERGEFSLGRKDVLAISDNLNGFLAITDTSSKATQLDDLLERPKFRASVLCLSDYSDQDMDWQDNGDMINITGDIQSLKQVEANLEAAEVITSKPNTYATYHTYYAGYHNSQATPMLASSLGFEELSFPSDMAPVFLDRKSDNEVVQAYRLTESFLRKLGAPGDTLHVLEDRGETPIQFAFKKGDLLRITQDEVVALDPRKYRPTQVPYYQSGNTPF